MDAAHIEKEIRRLAPWYNRFHLKGVSTDITPPCDPDGHREITCPPIHEGFWRGRTVLDVACAEGAWGFGALEHGAAHVDAFDCREANIEKARFVAEVLGHERIDFHVESCGSWMAKHGDRKYDLVFLCGILYHLPEPWRTIELYTQVATEWIYVVSLVHGGGEDGYTRVAEPDHISASEGSRDSMVPNSMYTLLAEFARHHFRPVHIEETRGGPFGGGCCLVLRNCAPWRHCRWEGSDRAAAELDLHLVPIRAGGGDPAFDLQVTVYNRGSEAREVECHAALRDDEGEIELDGPISMDLPPRVTERSDPPSHSRSHVTRIEPGKEGGERRVEVELRDPRSQETIQTARLVLPAEMTLPES